MTENLAEQLRSKIVESRSRLQSEADEESARRAAEAEANLPLVLRYAEERLPQFIGALTTKLEKAAEERKREASIRWTSGDLIHVEGARAAMEQAAVHFQEEGLQTKLSDYDNAREGAAHGELEYREFFPANEWTTVLTASVPERESVIS